LHQCIYPLTQPAGPPTSLRRHRFRPPDADSDANGHRFRVSGHLTKPDRTHPTQHLFRPEKPLTLRWLLEVFTGSDRCPVTPEWMSSLDWSGRPGCPGLRTPDMGPTVPGIKTGSRCRRSEAWLRACACRAHEKRRECPSRSGGSHLESHVIPGGLPIVLEPRSPGRVAGHVPQTCLPFNRSYRSPLPPKP
jgi:hypothetical protein